MNTFTKALALAAVGASGHRMQQYFASCADVQLVPSVVAPTDSSLAVSAAGTANAATCNLLTTDEDCAKCISGQVGFSAACFVTQADQACPSGAQATIDELYLNCDGLTFDNGDWEAVKPDIKASAEACGCGGAAQAAPLIAALAAVVNHFLN